MNTSLVTLVNFYLEEDCASGKCWLIKINNELKRNPVLDNSIDFSPLQNVA